MPETQARPYVSQGDYIPAMDGLRGLAILPVFLSHAGMGLEHLFPGTLGVVLFFVISGFLITRQLAEEAEPSGTLRLGAFYRRRALRLLPPLLAYLALFIPLLLRLGAHITPLQAATGMLGLANYYHILTDTLLTAPCRYYGHCRWRFTIICCFPSPSSLSATTCAV